ncbi:hypothetical protein A2U01_0095065, partial [Trifolium medium]|nr:hypothetical protein [Trifolium medium]
MVSVCLTKFDNCGFLSHDVRCVPDFDANIVGSTIGHASVTSGDSHGVELWDFGWY